MLELLQVLDEEVKALKQEIAHRDKRIAEQRAEIERLLTKIIVLESK